jgi:hypothetical protein
MPNTDYSLVLADLPLQLSAVPGLGMATYDYAPTQTTQLLGGSLPICYLRFIRIGWLPDLANPTLYAGIGEIELTLQADPLRTTTASLATLMDQLLAVLHNSWPTTRLATESTALSKMREHIAIVTMKLTRSF